MAAPVEGLYEADVVVQGQTTEQRNEAIGAALEKVLIKVTGHPDILSRGELSGALREAPSYVQEYRYRAAKLVEPQGSAPAQQQMLRVRFDPAAVDRLLRQRGLPVWSVDRPAVLVWLGFESKGKRSLYVPETDPEPQEALEQAAWQRGLPLLFPLFDLEDQSAVQLSDLWGGFDANIRAASQRYAPDVILVGRLRAERSGWQGDWSLLQAGAGDARWQSGGPDLESVIDGGINWLADTLAARYAPMVTGGSGPAVLLRVSGVGDLLDYGRVRAYVEGLSMVDELTLAAVDAGRVSFRLQVRGGVATLEQALRASGRLAPAPPASMVVPGAAPGHGGHSVGQGAPGTAPRPDVLPVADPGTVQSAADAGGAQRLVPAFDGITLDYRIRP